MKNEQLKEIFTSRDNKISINLIGHDIVMISNGEIRVYDMDKAIDYAQFVARMKNVECQKLTDSAL